MWHTCRAELIALARRAELSGTRLWTALVAILGPTISPYLFFWQASQEIEEQHRRHVKPLCVTPKDAGPELKRIRVDTLVGMAFSTLVSLAIVFATAATLHASGVRDIATSSQAAEALRPIAGQFAFAMFAIGIIGTGLLAVPVLAGSAAYAASELFGWKAGLSHGFHEARGFYLIIVAATGIGSAMGFFDVDPMKALVLSAIVNGVISVPIMVVMMLIGHRRRDGALHRPRHRLLAGPRTWGDDAAVAFMFGPALTARGRRHSGPERLVPRVGMNSVFAVGRTRSAR